MHSHIAHVREKYTEGLGFSPTGPRLVHEGYVDGYLDPRLPGAKGDPQRR